MKIRLAVIGNEYREFLCLSFQNIMPQGIEIAYLLNDDMEETDATFCGIKIISLEELCQLYQIQVDAVLIAAGRNHYVEKTIQSLQKKEIWKIYLPKLYALDKKKDLWNAQGMVSENMIYLSGNDPFLVHLETHILDDCNLNCKACNNFAPFAESGEKASLQQLEKDLQRVKELFCGIGRFFLLGGEPLLDPSLTKEFVKLTRKELPDTEIRLFTNGLRILSMKDSFWDVMRQNHIIIHISAYPPTMEKMHEISAVLDAQNVEWISYGEVKKFIKHWTEYPFENKDLSNELCGSSGCHYLRNGKIAKCPDSILVRKLDEKCQTSLYQHDETDIYKEDDGWDLQQKLIGPCQLCSYCSLDRMEFIPWETIGNNPKKEDWMIEHRYEYLLKQTEQQSGQLKQQCDQLEQQCGQLRQQREQLELEVQTRNNMNEELTQKLRKETESKQAMGMELLNIKMEKEKEVTELKEKMQELSDNSEGKDRQLSSILKEKERLEMELQDVYTSHSWKVTYIFRIAKTAIQRWQNKIKRL